MLVSGVLMSWDDARTIVDRLEGTLDLAATVLPRGVEPGSTYQGFCKAMRTRGAGVLAQARRLLREQVLSRGSKWERRLGFVAFAADGSRIICPRTLGNEAEFGYWGKESANPQMNLTVLWHMGTGLSWDWRIAGSRTGERALLLEMLPELPPRALLVADAGFTGFELLSTIQQSGRFFLVRVGAGVELLKELGVYQREGPDTVYLWPAGQHQRRPLVLRLIRVGQVYLITNVLNRTRLTVAKAGALYRLRWGVEVGFRTLKQTLERRKVRGAAPAQARLEVEWAMLSLTLLGLLSVRGLKRRRTDPLRWSPAAALRVTRRWRRRPAGPLAATDPGQLLRQLGTCLRDNYQRTSSKRARSWPHKKNPRPPGPPTLTRANTRLRNLAAARKARP